MIDVLRATPTERADLARLFEQIELEAGRPASAARAGLERSLAHFDTLASDSAWLFLARAAGRPVGYAVAARIPKLDARIGFVVLDELHVLEPHRRLGIASALVEAVCEQAARLDYAGVRLLVRPDNRPAKALYAKLGFDSAETLLCERLGTDA